MSTKIKYQYFGSCFISTITNVEVNQLVLIFVISFFFFQNLKHFGTQTITPSFVSKQVQCDFRVSSKKLVSKGTQTDKEHHISIGTQCCLFEASFLDELELGASTEDEMEQAESMDGDYYPSTQESDDGSDDEQDNLNQ